MYILCVYIYIYICVYVCIIAMLLFAWIQKCIHPLYIKQNYMIIFYNLFLNMIWWLLWGGIIACYCHNIIACYYCHVIIAMLLLPYYCCHVIIAMLLLPYYYCHVIIAILLLPFIACYYLHRFACYCHNTICMLLFALFANGQWLGC